MKAYFINANTNEHAAIDVTPTLENYHALIDCDCIDIAVRRVGGIPFNIVLDDEGLLKPNRIGGVATDCEEVLAGNLLLFGISEDDWDLRGLTEREVTVIERNVVGALFEDFTIGNVLAYETR